IVLYRRRSACSSWTTLASANPSSLCVLLPFEEDMHPAIERHVGEAVYNERRSHREGLVWTAHELYWLLHYDNVPSCSVMEDHLLDACNSHFNS
uniref:Fanconi-associated nuclease n=1 Tax=Mesocestoides corti TaxID=53468 RepID=A0A5K3G0X9_MESCO